MVVKGLAISGDRLFWATLRRASDCDRREDRQVDLEQDARRLEEGPSVQCRAARRQGQGHPRAGDKRIRRQLLDRRVRRPHRKAGLEIQYRRGARRARQRYVAGRLVAARRLADLGDRLLRSGNEPDVLGHRQPESRLDRRPAKPGRQSLLRLCRCPRRRHREAQMALPVHAERRVRLGLRTSAGARRHHLAGAAAQGDAVGESQRVLLRAGSRHRSVPDGQGVREAELEQRIRCEGAAHQGGQRQADAEGTYIEPGTQGGTNWYSPSYSPRTGLFYVSAWDNYSVISRKADVPPWEAGKKYTGRTSVPSGGRRGGAGGRPDAHVPHGGGGLRRGPRDRSEDRREEVGLQDGRLHRERNPDDRLGPALLGRSRGPLRRARRADRRAALEHESRGHDCERSDHVSRSMVSSTWPWRARVHCTCSACR